MDIKANKRIDWIDCAKGIGILLMIFAHCIHVVPLQVLIRGFIFSFHMPLFFILYGVTFRFSDDKRSFVYNLKKRFRHLVIPALISYLIITFIDLLYSLDHLDIVSFIRDHAVAVLFCAGADYDIGSFHVSSVSMTWFLFVLFFASVIIDFCHLHFTARINVLFYSLLSVAGFLIIFYGFGLPFALETVFLVIPFIISGRLLLTKIKVSDLRIIAISLISWIALFYVIAGITNTYLEIAGRRFPLFPLCHIAAVAGSVFICGICGWFTKLKFISAPFVTLGRYTLWVLIAHLFDYTLFFIWDISDNNYLNAVIRITVDIILAFIIYKSRQLILSAFGKKSLKLN